MKIATSIILTFFSKREKMASPLQVKVLETIQMAQSQLSKMEILN